MVIQVLAADSVAVSVRIVSPTQDAGVRKVGRKEITEPVETVRGCPCFVSMAVQAMNGDDARKFQFSECKTEGRLTRRLG